MKSCDGYRSNILLYLDGELRGQVLEDFRAHISNCAECRALLGKEEALSRLLHQSRPLYSAPKSVRDRVSAAVSQHGSTADYVSKPLRKGMLHLLKRMTRKTGLRTFGWRPLLAVVPVIVLFLVFVPVVMRQARAMSYVETALATHQNYLDGNLPLQIQSDSPEAVTAWFAGKVPFHVQLPTSQMRGNGKPAYRLTGARLVNYRGNSAALISYEMQRAKISLLITSSKVTVAAGGDVVRSDGLVFHYRNNAGFKVITWTNEGLTYALVSSLPGTARQSCLVCHQAMSDKNNFK